MACSVCEMAPVSHNEMCSRCNKIHGMNPRRLDYERQRVEGER